MAWSYSQQEHGHSRKCKKTKMAWSPTFGPGMAPDDDLCSANTLHGIPVNYEYLLYIHLYLWHGVLVFEKSPLLHSMEIYEEQDALFPLTAADLAYCASNSVIGFHSWEKYQLPVYICDWVMSRPPVMHPQVPGSDITTAQHFRTGHDFFRRTSVSMHIWHKHLHCSFSLHYNFFVR